ncbi:MAG TPA: pantoate--beta-alanine ligase [Acidimicrobiales bacterium]
MTTTLSVAPVDGLTLLQPAPPSAVPVMETIDGYARRLDAARRSGRTVGVVPTMGALHDGHRSLIRRAATECDVVAVSIFVNPTQFGDEADLAAYPRALGSDLETVASAGGHLVFAPSVAEMYPDRPGSVMTVVSHPALAGRWEGASRPGHFDGVATVVTKLLSAAGRCRAYFGEKDFQQLALVRRVARDLSLPAEVVGCDTVRDGDGLARSSRNSRLSPAERRAAAVLSRALRSGASLVVRGEESPTAVRSVMEQVVAAEPAVELDYAAVVQADDLEPAVSCASDRPLRLLIAAAVGPVRLIDNLDPRRGH